MAALPVWLARDSQLAISCSYSVSISLVFVLLLVSNNKIVITMTAMAYFFFVTISRQLPHRIIRFSTVYLSILATVIYLLHIGHFHTILEK
jgi:hypothetical protein